MMQDDLSPQAATAQSAQETWFDAALHPNRSLSAKGFRNLMVVVAAITAVSALRFWVLGAWPVAFFFVLDAGLIWGAFKLNYWSGQRREMIRLTRDGLHVAYISPGGRRRTTHLEPYFAKVDVRDRDSHRAEVRLISRGHQAIVGSFLSKDERLEMAAALDEALHRFKNNLPPASLA